MMHYIYIDEAGRWPIAGPVYVGIVVVSTKSNALRRSDDLISLPWFSDACFVGYDDSKVIAEAKREELYEKICSDKNISFAFGFSKSTEVDSRGIVRSIRTAIAKALWSHFVWEPFSIRKFQARIKECASELVLVVDGKTDFWMRKLWGATVQPVVDGDAKIPMIGAASIVAKVERDRKMRQLHKKFPQYEFDTHKWYGTEKHYALIRQHGLCKEHRKSWISL